MRRNLPFLNLSFSLTLLLTLHIRHGQAQSVETQIDYRKTRQSAASIQLSCPSGTINDAIMNYMGQKGYKGISARDYLLFRAVRMNDTDSMVCDLYFLTDRKRGQEKDKAVVNLLAASRNEDLLTRTTPDNSRMQSARLLLDSLAPFVEAHNVRLQTVSQTDVVKKAQNRMDKLMNEQTDLDRRIRRLQTDLDQNKKDQQAQTTEIQTNINADEPTKRKMQKKLNSLLDDQGSLEKKLRKTQADLDQNKADQAIQQQEIARQKQTLDAIRARQNN